MSFHIITVTGIPTDESDDYDWRLDPESAHGIGCEVWRECPKAWHRHPKNEWGEMDTEWSTKRVPIEHQWIEGEWMVPTNECGFSHVHDFSDVREALAQHEAEVGSRWHIALEWEDDWFATLLKRVEVSRGSGS